MKILLSFLLRLQNQYQYLGNGWFDYGPITRFLNSAYPADIFDNFDDFFVGHLMPEGSIWNWDVQIVRSGCRECDCASFLKRKHSAVVLPLGLCYWIPMFLIIRRAMLVVLIRNDRTVTIQFMDAIIFCFSFCFSHVIDIPNYFNGNWLAVGGSLEWQI